MKALLMNTSLGMGGAEKMNLWLAEMLAEHHEVGLAICQNTGELLAAVPRGVSLTYGLPTLEGMPFKVVFPYLVARWLGAMRGADVIITSCELTTALAARTKAFHGTPVIAWVHKNIGREPMHIKGLVPNFLRNSYKKADHLVFVSKGSQVDMARYLGPDLLDRSSVVYNPVLLKDLGCPSVAEAAIAELRQRYPDSPVALTVGRLHPVKRLDRFIESVALVRQSGVPVVAVIAGEGAQRTELEALVRRLNLTDFVRMPGNDLNPIRALRAADRFVLCSDSEGLSLVVLEALYAGTPIVSTDCPTGPREILNGGEFGYLCECSAEGVARGLAASIGAPLKIDADRLSAQLSMFMPDTAAQKWREAIALVTAPLAKRCVHA